MTVQAGLAKERSGRCRVEAERDGYRQELFESCWELEYERVFGSTAKLQSMQSFHRTWKACHNITTDQNGADSNMAISCMFPAWHQLLLPDASKTNEWTDESWQFVHYTRKNNTYYIDSSMLHEYDYTIKLIASSASKGSTPIRIQVSFIAPLKKVSGPCLRFQAVYNSCSNALWFSSARCISSSSSHTWPFSRSLSRRSCVMMSKISVVRVTISLVFIAMYRDVAAVFGLAAFKRDICSMSIRTVFCSG